MARDSNRNKIAKIELFISRVYGARFSLSAAHLLNADPFLPFAEA